MEQRPKVLITNPSIPQVAFDFLGEKCDLIVTLDETRKSILEKLSTNINGILWATPETLDAEILDKVGSEMKTVVTMSGEVNNIDLAEIKKRGIQLGYTPVVLDEAVADVAVLLTLAASRRLHEGNVLMEKNEWKFTFQWLLGQDISESTIGLVGFGGIGQAIVRKLKAFNVQKFIYTDDNEKPEAADLNAELVSFDNLIKSSDFIIVSPSSISQKSLIFKDEEFSKMKSSTVFVNVSHGGVIDQEALIKALKSNKIFAAGLDVMTPEPLPVDNELYKLPNLVLTPHLGSATIKTRNAMAELSAQNMLRGLGGAEMFTPFVLE